MSDIYSDSVYVQIKSPCKKRFPSPLKHSQSRDLGLIKWAGIWDLRIGIPTPEG